MLMLLAIAAFVAACGPQVAPTDSTAESGPLGSSAPSPDATSPASPRSSEAAGGQEPTLDPLASPPPVGDPQDSEACLAVIPRADVEAALNTTVSEVIAIGTDPTVSLTCTYVAGDGALLVSTAAGDAATGFQSSLDLATSYGQNPITIDGLGDQAFYARSADRWPEQVVFVKGPVLVRLVNQSPTTIGEVPFAALAATAAEAIRAGSQPAP